MGINMNKNKCYDFDGSISIEVLNNYLDKAITYVMEKGAVPMEFDEEHFKEGVRFVTNVGAKYIQRAACSWYPTIEEIRTYPRLKKAIEKAHDIDPEIIFEACIFETTTSRVDNIPIPERVFEAFGLKPEKRNFKKENMHFLDGFRRDFDNEADVPDVTRLDTQMFIYYRAITYIDIGFEALHLGQVKLIGHNDKDYACYDKIIKMIRKYASEHARRHYVLINAHDNYFLSPDGNYLADMLVAPIRVHAAPDEVDHAVSEDNPQRCDIEAGYWGDSIYQSGISGTSPSGWYAEKYPYLVEFDNYGGKMGDTTKKDSYVWGMDEISWYCSQPQWYRREFMKFITEKIHSFNENGHVALVGYRGGPYISYLGKSAEFFSNSSEFCENGFDDEEAIKELFANQ